MKDKKSYEQGPITGLTPELMEGYVNRTLSPQLMQRIKEFLDNNPFEAEAIEGLESHSLDLAGELQDLEGRLSRKLSSNNQFRFYWPVAAAVSLLVVSGVLFYFLMPGQADKVALNQESTEVKTEQLETVPETTLVDDVAPAPASEIKEETEIVAVPDNEEIEDLEESIKANFDVETAAVINNREREIQSDKTAIIDEPKLQSSQSGALPIDNLIEEQESTVQEGVIVRDSQRQAAPQATARSKAKKTAVSTASELTASTAELPMAKAPAEINEYLKKHTHYPKTAKAEGVQGTVIVTFIVNEKGGLEDFEIVRELGYGCDEEAVKTLQQGPSWKPAEINGIPVKSRGQIEVEFPPPK